MLIRNCLLIFFASTLVLSNPFDLFAQSALLTKSEVQKLLTRASMATPSQDAIIAVVDRAGRILGVRVEADADANFAAKPSELIFSVDGAVAKARTAAMFSNGGPNPADGAAPLTSRTIRFISQSTIAQREVASNPNVGNFASIWQGPGFVAPIGVGGRFPPEVANTPLVDLFAIEHQGRDSRIHPGEDGIKGTGDDIVLAARFDVDLAWVPPEAQAFMQVFPESYGTQSGDMTFAQSRGFGTLPGGIGIYKNQQLVGGLGVFFPGGNGQATNEQGFVHASARGRAGKQSEADRMNAPKALEAEFIAYFATGGATFGDPTIEKVSVAEFERATIPTCPGISGPIGRIDLVGITLEIYGPNPTRDRPVGGARRLIQVGRSLGGGSGTNSGRDLRVTSPATPEFYLDGMVVPHGWLVLPHASTVDPRFTAADVEGIIMRGIAEAEKTRAAIRLNPLDRFRPGAKTRMVLAVADTSGEVLGLYRMPDATTFSIDVAVAKARNTGYYAGEFLVDFDRVDQNNDGRPDLDQFKAFTNRTFRFLAGPNFPTGAMLGPPGDFSILNMPGINPQTAENTVDGSPLPASVYASNSSSVVGYDAFRPSRNFRAGRYMQHQNGIVFFPGSSPLYKPSIGNVLVGGFGVSGDGVDQDDVVTVAGQVGFEAPTALRADQYFISGVRLPYQKFNRNPQGK